MEKNKVSNEKIYNPMRILRSGIVLELILLSITLYIGDAISAVSETSFLLTRYIPIGVVTLITTFSIIKNNSKKFTKSDEKIIKRNVLIMNVVVAIILLCYGLYSVNVNIEKAKDELKIYSLIWGEEVAETLLDTAIKEARTSWMITAFTYFIVAEGVAIMTSKKINTWLKDDIIEESVNTQVDVNESIVQENQETVNSIKWNL